MSLKNSLSGRGFEKNEISNFKFQISKVNGSVGYVLAVFVYNFLRLFEKIRTGRHG